MTWSKTSCIIACLIILLDTSQSSGIDSDEEVYIDGELYDLPGSGDGDESLYEQTSSTPSTSITTQFSVLPKEEDDIYSSELLIQVTKPSKYTKDDGKYVHTTHIEEKNGVQPHTYKAELTDAQDKSTNKKETKDEKMAKNNDDLKKRRDDLMQNNAMHNLDKRFSDNFAKSWKTNKINHTLKFPSMFTHILANNDYYKVKSKHYNYWDLMREKYIDQNDPKLLKKFAKYVKNLYLHSKFKAIKGKSRRKRSTDNAGLDMDRNWLDKDLKPDKPLLDDDQFSERSNDVNFQDESKYIPLELDEEKIDIEAAEYGDFQDVSKYIPLALDEEKIDMEAAEYGDNTQTLKVDEDDDRRSKRALVISADDVADVADIIHGYSGNKYKYNNPGVMNEGHGSLVEEEKTQDDYTNEIPRRRERNRRYLDERRNYRDRYDEPYDYRNYEEDDRQPGRRERGRNYSDQPPRYSNRYGEEPDNDNYEASQNEHKRQYEDEDEEKARQSHERYMNAHPTGETEEDHCNVIPCYDQDRDPEHHETRKAEKNRRNYNKEQYEKRPGPRLPYGSDGGVYLAEPEEDRRYPRNKGDYQRPSRNDNDDEYDYQREPPPRQDYDRQDRHRHPAENHQSTTHEPDYAEYDNYIDNGRNYKNKDKRHPENEIYPDYDNDHPDNPGHYKNTYDRHLLRHKKHEQADRYQNGGLKKERLVRYRNHKDPHNAQKEIYKDNRIDHQRNRNHKDPHNAQKEIYNDNRIDHQRNTNNEYKPYKTHREEKHKQHYIPKQQRHSRNRRHENSIDKNSKHPNMHHTERRPRRDKHASGENYNRERYPDYDENKYKQDKYKDYDYDYDEPPMKKRKPAKERYMYQKSNRDIINIHNGYNNPEYSDKENHVSNTHHDTHHDYPRKYTSYPYNNKKQVTPRRHYYPEGRKAKSTGFEDTTQDPGLFPDSWSVLEPVNLWPEKNELDIKPKQGPKTADLSRGYCGYVDELDGFCINKRPTLYGHPVKNCFIQCDAHGNSFIRTCPAGLKWMGGQTASDQNMCA